MTVDAIKELIEELPPEEQAHLASWMSARDSRAWDDEIEADFSPGGAGMALLQEVDRMIESQDVEAFKVTRPRE